METRMRVSAVNGATQLCIFEQRIAPGKALPVEFEERRREVIARVPLFDRYRQGLVADRFQRVFHKRLVFEPPA